MRDVTVIKHAVIPDKGKIYLTGVAVCEDEGLNFKVPYELKGLEWDEFFAALRDTLAREFDVKTTMVSIPEREIIERMIKQSLIFERAGLA